MGLLSWLILVFSVFVFISLWALVNSVDPWLKDRSPWLYRFLSRWYYFVDSVLIITVWVVFLLLKGLWDLVKRSWRAFREWEKEMEELRDKTDYDPMLDDQFWRDGL